MAENKQEQEQSIFSQVGGFVDAAAKVLKSSFAGYFGTPPTKEQVQKAQKIAADSGVKKGLVKKAASGKSVQEFQAAVYGQKKKDDKLTQDSLGETSSQDILKLAEQMKGISFDEKTKLIADIADPSIPTREKTLALDSYLGIL